MLAYRSLHDQPVNDMKGVSLVAKVQIRSRWLWRSKANVRAKRR
jgi:hypothetical protein